MSRSTYAGWLNVWDDGDNPGAGSKVADSTGLNGNFVKVSDAIQAEHNVPSGTHKNNIIDKANLKTTVADGSTIELNASVGLRAKDDGITGTKIAAAAVDDSTLEASAATGSKVFRVKDAGITGAKLASGVADASTIELSGGSLRVKDGGLQAAKLAVAVAGANIIGKQSLYIYDSATSFFLFGTEFAVDATVRIPIAPKGSIIRFMHVNELTGAVTSATGAYFSNPNGLDFSSGLAYARLHVDYSSTKYRVLVEGSAGGTALEITMSRTAGMLWVEYVERP